VKNHTGVINASDISYRLLFIEVADAFLSAADACTLNQ